MLGGWVVKEGVEGVLLVPAHDEGPVDPIGLDVTISVDPLVSDTGVENEIRGDIPSLEYPIVGIDLLLGEVVGLLVVQALLAKVDMSKVELILIGSYHQFKLQIHYTTLIRINTPN